MTGTFLRGEDGYFYRNHIDLPRVYGIIPINGCYTAERIWAVSIPLAPLCGYGILSLNKQYTDKRINIASLGFGRGLFLPTQKSKNTTVAKWQGVLAVTVA